MVTAIWIALGFLLVASIASATLAAMRGLSLWRGFRAFSGTAEAALDSVMQAAATTEGRSAALAENQERLQKATEHLQTSLAQLALLRAAVDEVRIKLDRLGGVVPSK